MVEALGLNTPEQFEYLPEPEKSGFAIYDDFAGPGISARGSSNGHSDFYSEDSPTEGLYCIHWTEATQYQTLDFDFRPNKDLSNLKEKDYALDLWVRGDSPSTRLAIRFRDTKTDALGDRPWRMGSNVDSKLVTWNGEWQNLVISLGDMVELGAWDNAWYNPRGLFDWTAVDRLEIVAEHHNLTGIQFWFDEIHIKLPSRRR